MTYEIIELILDPTQEIPPELKEWEVVSRADDGDEITYILKKTVS